VINHVRISFGGLSSAAPSLQTSSPWKPWLCAFRVSDTPSLRYSLAWFEAVSTSDCYCRWGQAYDGRHARGYESRDSMIQAGQLFLSFLPSSLSWISTIADDDDLLTVPNALVVGSLLIAKSAVPVDCFKQEYREPAATRACGPIICFQQRTKIVVRPLGPAVRRDLPTMSLRLSCSLN
jgi:hypothetical protein